MLIVWLRVWIASIALEPANSSHEVRILPPNRVKIQGKLVGLFRRY